MNIKNESNILETVFHSLNDLIMIILPDYKIVKINKAASLFFSILPEEAAGKKNYELFGRKGPYEDCCVDQVIKTQQPASTKRYEEALDKWFEVNAYPVFDKDGNIKHIVEHLKDITDLHLAQENLYKAKEEAEYSDKIKALILTNLSYEMRIPMNGILGFAELLKNERLPEAEKVQYINIILKNGNQLVSLVNDLIDFSRLESGKIELHASECSINEMLDDLYRSYQTSIIVYKSNNLELECKKGLGDIEGHIDIDGQRLKQILNNLLRESFKHTSEGLIEFGYTLKDKNTLTFYVKDTGMGYAFEYYTKENIDPSKINYTGFKETGLITSLTKGLVKLFNGKIWIESAPGEGSTTYFTIPYKPSKVSVADDKTIIPDEIDWSDKYFIIAEDEPLNYLYLQTILRKTNANLIWVKNGKEVIEILQANKRINLILMDLKMPHMDGMEATQEIRKFNKSIPIIAQTAFAMEEDQEKCFRAGFTDYLPKPLKKNILLNMIHKHIEIKAV